MSIKLLILGLLMEGEKHPYEVQQLVKQRGIDCYIKFAKGSLYYAFDQLAKASLIEVANIIRESNRPDKTTYRITDKGKEELQQLLLTEMRRPIQLHNPIYAALTFAAYGDPAKMEEASAENMREVQRVAELLESILEEPKQALDFGARNILIGAIEHLRAEARWIERVRQEGFGH
ncbi:transcriptional regulator [Brevibacillus reuszeri]|uniref:Transcriptional regulator n=1 Tax=Brevibacillus reuszeri TaxID=54915 RepID=A0A0K9YX58_9BACL|nr:PadR family transcriptional regulator [Brevibacillus reuszeri]KNB73222.1 transcriptional regulator [Brevibacillus reuszeri]MED1856827.1 PadR family transcriptional regulator [Brevibacillus reuszeri]GED68424.1 transcriptional regulator [Brevibacillus reuszeri]